jgi:hypothetical protein
MSVKEAINSKCTKAKLAGDDGSGTFPKYSILSLNRMRYFAKEQLGVTIKPGPPTEHNDYFFSKVDNATGKIVIEGNVFLQRRFVWATCFGLKQVLPYRPIEAYWPRIGRAASIPSYLNSEPGSMLRVFAYYRMRWVGLLYDTMETNTAAAEQLRFCIEWLDRYVTTHMPQADLKKYISDQLAQEDKPRWLESVVEYSHKLGFTTLGYNWINVPPAGHILSQFVVHEESRRIIDAWKVNHFLPHHVLVWKEGSMAPDQ